MDKISKKAKKRVAFPIYDARRRSLPESEVSFIELIRERRARIRKRRWELEAYAFTPFKVVLEDMGEFGKIPHRVRWSSAEAAVRKRARARIKRRGRGNWEW